jgi:beta-lactamase class A
VSGNSLRNRIGSRSLNPAWIFGFGFLSGFLVAVLLGGLQPNFINALLRDFRDARPASTATRTTNQAGEVAGVLPPPELTQGMGDLAPYFTLVHAAQMTQDRLALEAAADANLKRSKELAVQGIAVRDAGRADGKETLDELLHQEFLWASAIRQIDQIPSESVLIEAAAQKRVEYAEILAPVAKQVDRIQSGFLAAIAEATGRPQAIRITLCHLSGECRDYQGNVPPASPASLIKVPVALVLMHKVTTEKINFEEPIYIDPRNWTETADGEGVFVKKEYPLRVVMERMINESNNIATNQLMDYLGWDYLNQTLEELGYTQTEVRTKLVGERIIPTHNRRVGTNEITTNELTDMMRQIYTFTNPEYEAILNGLVSQYDDEFGRQAVSQLKNKRVAWIGEKTGQNSKVIGSSMAVKIDKERYILTVTIDNSANQVMLRQVIRDTLQHILDEGHLVPVKQER